MYKDINLRNIELSDDLKRYHCKEIREQLENDFNCAYPKALKAAINHYFKSSVETYEKSMFPSVGYACLSFKKYLFKLLEEMPRMKKINKGTIISRDIDQSFKEAANENQLIYLDSIPLWFDTKNNVCFLDTENIGYYFNKRVYDETYLFENYRLRLDEYVQEIDSSSNYVSTDFAYIDENSEYNYVAKIEDVLIKINICDSDIYFKALIGEEYFYNLQKACIDYNNRIGRLSRLPLTELRKKDTQLFNNILFENIFAYLEIDKFSDEEKEIVKEQLYLSKNSGKIFRLLYTLLYTLRVFESDKDYYDYLDLTFITVSAFKVVEVVFGELLNKHFGHITIKDSENKTIDFSNPKLSLGNMQQFFTSTHKEIVSLLSKDKDRVSETVKILDDWRDTSRNHLLHKDIITIKDKQQLRQSITDSIVLLFNIVLIFKK